MPQYKKAKIRSKIRNAMFDQLYEHGMPIFRYPVKITYERHGNMMDTENLSGSSKLWIDRLTEYGVIEDDKPIDAGGHVSIHYSQRRGRAKTVICIEPLDLSSWPDRYRPDK